MKGLTISLVVILAVGIFLTLFGGYKFFAYYSDYSNSLTNISSGIIAGWSSTDVTNTGLRLWVNVSSGLDNAQMSIFITGFILSNRTQSTYVFSFVSPFVIEGFANNYLSFDTSEVKGNWTYNNIGDNLSAIYYTVQLNNCSITPCFENVYTETAVFITHLAFRDDHGQYALVIPFGGGESLKESEELPPKTNFINDLSHKVNFALFVGQDDNIISSFPNFNGAIAQWIIWPGQIEYTYGFINSTLSFSFDVSSEINNNNVNESLALLFLGVGIPLALSSSVEWYRDIKGPHTLETKLNKIQENIQRRLNTIESKLDKPKVNEMEKVNKE